MPSKSAEVHPSWGFNSPSRHHFRALMFATRGPKCADSRSQVPLSPFAGGQPRGPWPFCWGSEGEARAHEGKIEQSQAPRYKRGGMSGATLGLVLARDFT